MKINSISDRKPKSITTEETEKDMYQTDCFTREFTQPSKTDQFLMLHIVFQSMETEKEFQFLLAKNIIWISKSDKGATKKCKTILLVNTKVNILNRILASRIQYHIKKIIMQNQVGFI